MSPVPKSNPSKSKTVKDKEQLKVGEVTKTKNRSSSYKSNNRSIRYNIDNTADSSHPDTSFRFSLRSFVFTLLPKVDY